MDTSETSPIWDSIRHKLKRMAKYKLLLLLFALFTTQLWAATCVVVTTSEDEAEFFFSDNPTFTYDGQTVKLKTQKVEIEYTPQNIQKVWIDDRENTGIKVATANANKVSFSINDNSLTIHGCNPNENVQMFTTNGYIVSMSKSSDNGLAELHISNLQKGIYLVKTEETTVKFIKK